MDQNLLNNFGRGPPKDHLCEIILKLDQGFRRSCHLSQLRKTNSGSSQVKLTDYGRTDSRRTKTDHKSSPCLYVTGELKNELEQRFSRYIRKPQNVTDGYIVYVIFDLHEEQLKPLRICVISFKNLTKIFQDTQNVLVKYQTSLIFVTYNLQQ